MLDQKITPELRRNGHFYVLPKSVFFGQKSVFFPKKHPKFARSLIFIREKGTLFCTTFPGRGQTMAPLRKCSIFWARKLFGPKSVFAVRPQILSTERLWPSERRFVSHLGIRVTALALSARRPFGLEKENEPTRKQHYKKSKSNLFRRIGANVVQCKLVWLPSYKW